MMGESRRVAKRNSTQSSVYIRARRDRRYGLLFLVTISRRHSKRKDGLKCLSIDLRMKGGRLRKLQTVIYSSLLALYCHRHGERRSVIYVFSARPTFRRPSRSRQMGDALLINAPEPAHACIPLFSEIYTCVVDFVIVHGIASTGEVLRSIV